MTTQEQQMLQGLVERINNTRLADKDADAEQMIQQTLGRNPDALYVMAQTVLVQGYALDQAQKQIVDLKAQVDQARQHTAAPSHMGSFLGNLLGRHDGPAASTPPPPPVAGYGSGLAYPSGGYPIAGDAGQGGGFLRSAMQTATGVVAGELAFQGIESLMHGFGHAAGYGTEFGGAGLGGGRPEEIVNNYYGDSSAHEHGIGAASGLFDRSADATERKAESPQLGSAADTNNGATLQDASYVRDGTVDTLSGTSDSDTDYSSQDDDSMLSDDVGEDQNSDSTVETGADDSSGDSGGDDFSDDGGDSSNF